MAQWKYDLHLHSALSPCGSEDMTPNNMVNMALLAGLQLIALTDHNSCKNCPAFLSVAKSAGIAALPGMELTTSEEIHVVCLFPTLEDALSFDTAVYEQLPSVPNDPAIFGEQLILDENDQLLGTEPKLLLNATTISIDDVPALVASHHGICFPAHVDKDSFSILSTFGFIPDDTPFTAVEVFHMEGFAPDERILPKRLKRLTNSDAHYLWDIGTREATFAGDAPNFFHISRFLGVPDID